MTQVVNSIAEWRALRESSIVANQPIGFVPTMGALHQGHRRLLQRCRQENPITVLSIFVNPTQFNNTDDLSHYPRTFDADLKIAEMEGVDYLFLPQENEIYSDHYHYQIKENSLSNILCGQYRPGHFEGVLTVVMKLLHIIRPQRTYLGEKDYQQYLMIQGMANAFFLGIEIIPCPTVRDVDGLALSSRNQRLNPEQRLLAARFAQILQDSLHLSPEQVTEQLRLSGINVEYLEDRLGRRFAAVYIDEVRLIDNVSLTPPLI